ncbi:tyrosine-type recombinase/integrase [Burkholderia ubonensis]|uniref:tyrosine-type recombinase/integrase n=1 Tax=Burkholderia ubonensis TaxID=101571 RepID=UPI001E3A95E7|nr:tyrosine-type recombinase/integrase [Burkholderia ubonensis]
MTTDLALRWATTPVLVERTTWGRRLSQVRGFARWMSVIDSRNQIPPAGLLSARRRRNAPHIYTEQEIGLLMSQAARLRSRTGMRALTYSTLIGLLVATGLRPGEAFRLDRSDVDLVNGILSIRESKFGKSRFVPVEESTRVALERYARSRDRLCPLRSSEAFLVSESGMRLKAGTARSMFVRMSRAVGLRPATEDGRDGSGPRLQDFRHSFATGKLVEWYRADLDVSRELPKLAAYLGHVNVGLTYWYIEAVPELLELAAGYLGKNCPGERS